MLFGESDVAVVTGASGDLGRAIAIDLAAEGAAVAVCYHRNEAAADHVVEQIAAAGGRATAFQADVRDERQVAQLFRAVVTSLGPVRVLVNNAGANNDGLSMLMSLKKWQSVVSLDLDATFLCCRAATKVMMRDRAGAIVNVSSVSGILGTPGQANYAAAKAGVIGLTRVLAREMGPYNIRVNAVAPGFIEGSMTATTPKVVVDTYVGASALSRLGTPEEVASTVSFLASSRASYITGQTLVIDGGFTMQ